MFYLKFLIFTFLMIAVSLPLKVYANEGGAEAAKEGEKKEGGEGGKKEEPKESAQQEVLDLQARLTALKAKIASKKDNLKKLVEEKQATHNEKQAYEIVSQMKSEYKELQAANKQYDEQRALLNYRYPEKGLMGERKYERIEVKSLEEMEGQFSIEGKVKKTLARVRQQYPDKNKPAETKPNYDLPAAAQAPAKDSSRGAVTETQVLSK